MEQSEQVAITKPKLEIEPRTKDVYEGIVSGKYTTEDLQDLMDSDTLIENFLNIRGFERRLESYLQTGIDGVLVAVDVDDFKKFNDSQGHPAGDVLLKMAAEILREQTRVNPPKDESHEQRQQRNEEYEELDLLGRLGGDEFAVFLVGASIPDAIKAAKRIRHAIVAAVKQLFPDYGPEQTMSLGLSAKLTGDSALAIRQRADQALYLAKEGKESTYPEDAIAIN